MPDFKSEIRACIAGLNLSAERELEIIEELSQHLDEQYEYAISRGASEEEAKRAALEGLSLPDSLGKGLKSVERRRPLRRPPLGANTRGNMLVGVIDDIRFGLRMLAKKPGFAVLAILTLGIGIGASAAMLSVMQDVLIRPLPYAHSERLYAVWGSSDSVGQNRIAASGPDFLDYLEQNRSFAHIAEYLPRFTFTWTGDGEPRLVNCTAASEDFFPMLGIRPYLGRLYESREYTYFQNDTMVVSYRFWKNQLGGDPHVIGRIIRLQGESCTIIGVLPPMSDLFPDTDVWPKLTTRPSYPFMQWRGNKFLCVVGELRPGISPSMAEEDLTAILRRVLEEPRDVRVRLVSLKEDLIGNVRLPLITTLAAALLILVVACVNVAALLLARAVKRQSEMAVRLSLGAGLGRLVQQLVSEAMLLSGAGCAVGLLLAWGALRVLATIPNLALPRVDGVHLNAPALVVTAAIAIAITLLFGWIPSLGFTRLNLSSALRPRGLAIGGRRRSSLSALVVTEIACAVVLTTIVGLLVHSFWRVMHTNPGFQTQSLFRVYLRHESPPSGDPAALLTYSKEGRAFWESVLAEASSLPGVRSAALSDWRPGRDAAIATLVFDDRANDPTHLPSVEGSWTSADFFRTVGTSLVAGRSFTEHDNADAPAIVIINTETARQFWPGQNPIGKRIGINYTGPGRRGNNETPKLREVVGIVGSMKHGPLDAPAAPAVYMPYLQDETNHDMSGMGLLVRGEGNPMSLADGLRNRIHAVRPDQPVDVQSVQELVAQSVATRRYTVIFLSAFAAIGLLLVVTGVYGVISYATSQRTREFGVRIALGATRIRVISNVLYDGVVLIAVGSVVGIGGALVVTRSLSSLLYEVGPLDALSFCAAVGALATISLCACLLPAWKASRVDPIIAIRSDC
jgi:putative ABC transport system permease protein